MKVTGLNGREYAWNLNGYNVPASDTRKRSKYHVRARAVLKQIFHSYRILEEVKLPGSTPSHRKGVLYLDFYIPQIMLAIEVWCELNKIDIIVLKYSDTDEQWREQIENGE